MPGQATRPQLLLLPIGIVDILDRKIPQLGGPPAYTCIIEFADFLERNGQRLAVGHDMMNADDQYVVIRD